MADDMGYGDVSCFNKQSKIPTPNIDQLAEQGLSFIDAHAPSAVCTPTRYGVMTGRYCWRTRLKEGVSDSYDPPLIEKERLTVASLLKNCGYKTACIGKWHIGLTFHDKNGKPTEKEDEVDFSQPISNGPTDLGFEYAYYNAACGTCSPPYGFIENKHFIDKSFSFLDLGKDSFAKQGSYGQWSGMMAESWITKDADLIITQKACDFIEEQEDQDKPFFLYLTPNAPHEPCVEKFVPEFARGKSEAGARGDLVWLFDWTVGRIVEKLENTGQKENTLIIVTSDNGALPGDFMLDENGQRIMEDNENNEYQYHTYNHKSNAEWRGYKAHIWEGGHRIPLIIKWPGMVAQGKTSKETFCLTDIMATCAALNEYQLPDDTAEDSYNMLPAITGNKNHQEPIREATIHHSSFGVFSIRQAQWKLILDCRDSGGWPTPRGTHPKPGTPGQLYDIIADPHETDNLWGKRPEIVEKMQELLEGYKENGRSVPNRKQI